MERQISLPEHPVWVSGNSDQLTQVIVNLLSNAVKFAHPLEGKLWVRLIKQEEHAVLEIEDNGKGIPEKDKNLIFERFTQLSDQQLGKPKGSGLGLFICKTIIEQHQGHIFLGASREKGANFVVQLPLTTPPFQTSKNEEKSRNNKNNSDP